MPLSQWGPASFIEWVHALIPGPGLGDSSTLHYFEAGQGHKTPTVGRNGTHTRDSYGWEWDGKSFAERPEHMALHPHIQRRHQTEEPRKGMAFFPAATQLIERPHVFDAGDWDDFASGVTLSAIPSLFRTKTAQLISGDSADYIEHEIAGTSAGTRTYTVIVAERTATAAKFRIWNQTGSAAVVSVTLTFATGACAVTGSGTAWAVEIAPGIWKASVKFTQGSATEIWAEFYPNAGAGTAATELHYAGVVTGSQPVILSGPANSTGATDVLVHERAVDPQSSVHFLRFQPLSPTIENGVWILAGEAGEYPRLEYVQASGDVGVRYRHDAGTLAESLVTPSWTEGDDVEVALCLEYDAGDVRVRAGLRINGDDVDEGAVDEITEAQPTAWGGEVAIYLPDPAQPVGLILDCYKVVKLSDTYTPAIEGDMSALLSELSGGTLNDHGELVRTVRPDQPPITAPPTAPVIEVESVYGMEVEF